MVRVTPLVGAEDVVIGVIVLMDAHDGVSGSDGSPTERGVPSDASDAHASSQPSESDTTSDDS